VVFLLELSASLLVQTAGVRDDRSNYGVEKGIHGSCVTRAYWP